VTSNKRKVTRKQWLRPLHCGQKLPLQLCLRSSGPLHPAVWLTSLCCSWLKACQCGYLCRNENPLTICLQIYLHHVYWLAATVAHEAQRKIIVAAGQSRG